MADLIINSTLSDCYLAHGNAVYAVAWAAANATFVDTGADWASSPTIPCGQFRTSVGPIYHIGRPGLFFDTSPAAGLAIVSAVLSLYVTQWRSANRDFDVVVQSGQPTYPHEPAVAGDYDKGHYSGDYGSISSVGKPQWPPASDLQWRDIPIDIGILNLAGTTKLLLRSSHDIAGSTPGIAGSLEERVFFYRTHIDPAYAAYKPRLIITYTPPAPGMGISKAYALSREEL